MLTWTMTESGGREREDMAREVFFTLLRLLGCLGSHRSSSKLMSGVDSFTWVTRLGCDNGRDDAKSDDVNNDDDFDANNDDDDYDDYDDDNDDNEFAGPVS